MDSFEFNKIAGAVLGAVLFLMLLGKVSSALVHPHMPEKPHIDVKEEVAAAPAAGPVVVPALPAGGDPAAGQIVFQKVCLTCHTSDKGGSDKTGPNLFGVVGRKPGIHESFVAKYSACIKAKTAEWSDDTLNGFLWKPAVDCRATKMAMPGLKDKDRADVIAFLKSLK